MRKHGSVEKPLHYSSRRQFVEPEFRTCADCGQSKSSDSFYKRNSTNKHKTSYCKTCWRERVRARNLYVKYGITLERYEEMEEAQGFKCAICGAKREDNALDPNTGVPRRLAVDHDHETGEVRKLLCSYCNKLLGMAQDSTDILKKAVVYLEEHKNEV